MLAGVANYFVKILFSKLHLQGVYRGVSRFVLHSKIVKGLKTSKVLDNIAKINAIKEQRKFWFFSNFRYTRMFMYMKEYGVEPFFKRKLRKKFLPKEVRHMRFAWKTIRYFRPLGEKALRTIKHYEEMFMKAKLREDYWAYHTFASWVKENFDEFKDRGNDYDEIIKDFVAKQNEGMRTDTKKTQDKLDIINSFKKLPCEDRLDWQLREKALNFWYMFVVKSPETRNFSQFIHLYNPMLSVYRLPIRGWNGKWTRYYWYENIEIELIQRAIKTPNFGRSIYNELRTFSSLRNTKISKYETPFNKKGFRLNKKAN